MSGDLFKEKGDIEQAVEWYQKALDVDPELDYTREKLEELEAS